MKFLLTGASGFLGQHLINRLLAGGHEIVAIGRTKPEGLSENTEYLKADISDKQALLKCKRDCQGLDGIVHMAALVPKNNDEDKATEMLKVNATGTLNLLEVFGGGVRSFVYASTAEVYGLSDTEQPITEEALPQPLTNYGVSKLAGELLASVYSQKNNLRLSTLRFTVLYGPGDEINRAVPNFIKKALKGEDLDVFGGEELRDYLHVSDAAEALYLAAVKPVAGVFNIGTGQGTSIKDTAITVIKAVKSASRINIKTREKEASDIVLDITRAKKKLGFKPKYLFPDLIEEQIEWHSQNPK